MVAHLLDCFLCGDCTQLICDWKRKQYEDERMKKKIKVFSGLLLVSEIYIQDVHYVTSRKRSTGLGGLTFTVTFTAS